MSDAKDIIDDDRKYIVMYRKFLFKKSSFLFKQRPVSIISHWGYLLRLIFQMCKYKYIALLFSHKGEHSLKLFIMKRIKVIGDENTISQTLVV